MPVICLNFGCGLLGSRMPAATVLADLLFLLQAWQYAVEVVLLDAHLGGQLGDRDAGLPGHEGKRLGASLAGALAPAHSAQSSWLGTRLRCGLGCCPGTGRLALGTTRTAWSTARRGCGPRCRRGGSVPGGRNTGQRLGGSLQLAVLVDQRPELSQPVIYLTALGIKKISHGLFPCLSDGRKNVYTTRQRRYSDRSDKAACSPGPGSRP
jgi:hypothetical protein